MGTLHGTDLLAAVVVGAVGGLGAVLFAGLSAVARRVFAHLPTPARPLLGGLGLGLLALWSPYALTFGEAQLGGLVGARLAVSALVVAVVAKLAGTVLTLASGWKGGFIIPLFFMGAALGQIAHHLVPTISEPLLMAATMAALCAGVTKTPLGSTLVVTEMAGLALLPVILVAALVALAVAAPVTLIDSQRARPDGHGPRPRERGAVDTEAVDEQDGRP